MMPPIGLEPISLSTEVFETSVFTISPQGHKNEEDNLLIDI